MVLTISVSVGFATFQLMVCFIGHWEIPVSQSATGLPIAWASYIITLLWSKPRQLPAQITACRSVWRTLAPMLQETYYGMSLTTKPSGPRMPTINMRRRLQPPQSTVLIAPHSRFSCRGLNAGRCNSISNNLTVTPMKTISIKFYILLGSTKLWVHGWRVWLGCIALHCVACLPVRTPYWRYDLSQLESRGPSHKSDHSIPLVAITVLREP